MTDAADAAPENEEPDPTAAWPTWAQRYLDAYEKVPNETRAAEAAGVHRVTVQRLRQRDEAFAIACGDAREKSLDLLEETIFAAATAGLPVTKRTTRRNAKGEVIEETESTETVRNPTLAMFYLKRWRPEYREAYRVENTGPGGGPIQHEHRLIEEQAEEARAELDRLATER